MSDLKYEYDLTLPKYSLATGQTAFAFRGAKMYNKMQIVFTINVSFSFIRYFIIEM